MIELLRGVLQVYQVVFIFVFFAEGLGLTSLVLVSPHQSVYFGRVDSWRRTQVDQGTLLRIHVRVPQNKLIVLQVRHRGVSQFVPSFRLRPDALRVQSALVLLQLGEETGTHFQVGSPRVQKL